MICNVLKTVDLIAFITHLFVKLLSLQFMLFYHWTLSFGLFCSMKTRYFNRVIPSDDAFAYA